MFVLGAGLGIDVITHGHFRSPIFNKDNQDYKCSGFTADLRNTNSEEGYGVSNHLRTKGFSIFYTLLINIYCYSINIYLYLFFNF